MRTLEHFPNLVAMFLARAREKGDQPFLWHKAGSAWVSMSWSEAAAKVASLAAALKAIGLEPGDRVMLVSENRPEWCISDLAIMAAGCITVPTYVTNTERDHAHIIENSGAKAVIVSTAKLARTLLPAAIRADNAKIIIGMEDIRLGQSGSLDVYNWSRLIADHQTDPSQIVSAATARSMAGAASRPVRPSPSPSRTMREKASITRNCPGREGTATSSRQLLVPRSSAA